MIQMPYFQNKLVPLVSKELSSKLGTEVSVGNISIDILTHVHINDILIKDYKKDTMICINSLDNHHSLDLKLNKPFKFNGEKISIDGIKFYLDNTTEDSVFNITHTFSKNKKKDSTTTKANSAKSKGLDFLSLGKIDLKNVDFRLKDKYNYQTISLHVNLLEIDAKPWKFADSPWEVNSVLIHQPAFTMVHHPSPYRPKDLDPDYLNIPFNLNVGKLQLDDAQLRIYDEPLVSKKDAKILSFADLDVKNVNLDVQDAKIRTRYVQGLVRHFTAKEKSGLEIKELKADFFLNSYKTEAKNLVFKTNYSNLNGYLRFNYKHMREYLRFAAWVNVSAKMKNSNLSLKDLAYFTPALTSWNHLDIKFNTVGNGIMNDLMLTDFSASLNKDRLKTSGTMRVMDLFNGKGLNVLANLNQTVFDKNDIEYVFQKSNLPTEIDNIGKMNYKGQFKGNPIKFTLNGRLNTAHGMADLKETTFDLTNNKSPKYNGNVILYAVNLAQIVPSENPIQKITANLKVDGQGFDVSTLNTYVKGSIQQIGIQNSQYQDIEVDGNFKDKIFVGKINSNDPTLKISANGKISLQEEIPRLELNLGLNNIDLKKLGYSKKQLLFNSQVFAIGKGKNLDEMLGTMLLKEMYVLDMTQGGKHYDFSNLTVEKDVFEEGDKYIDINSDEIKASLVGKYKVTEIPKLLKEYLISYLTIDANRDNQIYSQTYFNLNLNLKNIRSYSKLFYEDLKNIEEGDINLRFDGYSNKLKLKGGLHNTEFMQFKVPYITISNESSNASFFANFDFDSVYFQNNLAITPLRAQLSQLPEGLKFSVELLNRTDEKFVDFNTIIKKNGSDYTFNILPFNSYFGRKVWTLNPDNEIKLNTDSKQFIVNNLELYKDRQVIKISNKVGDDKAINGKFEHVKLEELISGFMPILKSFKGDLNGEIDIENLLSKPTPVANLDIQNIEFEKEQIGDLSLKSNFLDNILQSNFSVKGNLINLSALGSFNTNTGVDSLFVQTKIYKLNVDFVNRLLKDLVYDMSGNLKGDLVFYGKLNALQSEGELYIDSLNTALNTIHTRYSARNQKITIIPGKFVLSDFNFKDEDGNSGVANGFISHDNFKNFKLFLDAESSKLLCMNTNSGHNLYFYGKVYADAKVQFRGTIGDRISINSQGKNLPESVLNIAFGSSQRTEKYVFFEFIKKDSLATKDLSFKSIKKSGGVNLNFDYEVNNFGKLYIIMDPELEDKIECTGNGRIKFEMTPETDMNIHGSYKINSGSYLFTYKNLVQRVFYFIPGGTMSFSGDPRDAYIDASAKFTTRASAQELVNAYFVGNLNDPQVQSAARSNVKVNIILNLKEKISQPKISYFLDIEQNNPQVTSAFESIQATTKNNESEMNKQVLGLLLAQRFYPPSFSGFSTQNSASSNVQTDVTNQLVDIMASKLSGIATEWIQSTFKGMNVDLRYRSYSQQTTQASSVLDARNELKFAVSQKLLNDRLIFNLGGNYDFGKSHTNSSNAYFGGDMDIEYLLSPQGNVRAKIYSTLSNDPLNSVYINKTGMGILFQKEFDKFDQLFKKKPR